MGGVILFTCLAVFFLVLALSKNILEKQQRQIRRLKSIVKQQQEVIDEKLDVPLAERILKPMLKLMFGVLKNLKPKRKENQATKKLQHDLILAGIRMPAEEYSIIKTIVVGAVLGFTILLVTILNLDMQNKLFICGGGVLLSILIPRYYLKAKIKTRQGNIRRQMPDIMDLLSVSIEAGLSFDGALVRLSQQTKNELTEEFGIMLKEIQMGRPRRDALKDLGARNDIAELRVFASSMMQAEQYGISMKNVLKSQASHLRVERRNRAEEKAMKAPVKMMIPIILFIFPVIFIILLAPAAFDVIKTMGG